jgi:SNF2 family DNA or RNA helicase
MEHQRLGVTFLRARERALIADQPGLGKSRVALEAAVEPVLIVGPAMVLDGGVWDDEITKWRPNLDAVQVPYSRLMVRNGRQITSQLSPELTQQWGTVIFDEAHYLKGRNTKWTLAAKQIRAERTYLLTGTPLPNWAHEAFTLLQLLYPDEARPGKWLGSYWRWVEDWFDIGEQYGKGGVVVSSHVVGELRKDRTWESFIDENWKDRMLLRLREDCLDLPPLTQQTIQVDMVSAQKKAYRELKKDFVTWLESGEEIAAWSTAAQLVKLAMCATGLDVIEPNTHASGKLDALQALLTDRPAPTLVVAHFRKSVEACADRAAAAGQSAVIVHGGTSKKMRAESVRAFQAGKVPVLCATLGTISEGLTLNAADQVIFVERSWRPSQNEQALRRIHRIGQTRPVTAIDLVTRDSVDERVLKVLAGKTDQQARALGLADLRGLVA